MDVRQIPLRKMAVFSYRIGDRLTGNCALIDPAFDTGEILRKVHADGYRVTHVINTHGHSDHTAGNRDIIARTGARLCIHDQDADKLASPINRIFSRLLGGKGSVRPDDRLHDGGIIRIGNARLNVLHTPGHTPGSICLYAPGHLFTGDTLFVGGVGRTDLPGGSSRRLLTSIQEKIYTLPGETKIWPGHDYGDRRWSTIAHEKANNPFTGGERNTI